MKPAYSNQFPTRRSAPKPKVGKLWYNNQIIMQDKPFGILQTEKRRLLLTGSYHNGLFKISY